MDPLTLAAISAGVGVLGSAQKNRQAAQQMEMQAMQNRFAPLFGQAPQAQMAQTSNPWGAALSGGIGGYQTAQNYKMMENALGLTNGGGGGGGNALATNTTPNPYGGMA